MSRVLLVLMFVLCGCVLCGCSEATLDDIAAEPGSAEPHLAHTVDGRAVLSYLEPAGEAMSLRYRVAGHSGWGPVQTVATGANWLVNWADFPSVQPLDENLWAAHWLIRRGSGYAYDIAVAVSEDGGTSWSGPMQPHLDDAAAEHGFVSLYEEHGSVGVVWLDGRHTLQGGATQLRAARLAAHAEVIEELPIANRVCDCCQTDLAVALEGPILVYRGRSADEIRDIFVTRRRDGQWSQGTRIAADNWRIAGCPVNGPAIDANGSKVVIAWYTAYPDKRVQVVFSDDSGASYDAPIDLQAAQTLGRVDVVLDAAGHAVVSWLQRGQGRLVARRVTREGELGTVREIAPMAANRDSGFPQMMRFGGGLIFAWTDTSQARSRVRARYIDAL